MRLKSIAFPCISTGIYVYPHVDAANVALTSIFDWKKSTPSSLEDIHVVIFDDDNFKAYHDLLTCNLSDQRSAEKTVRQ
jgi:O-acetyl-ADP-ribose deacetylase (regulator of RNase III)